MTRILPLMNSRIATRILDALRRVRPAPESAGRDLAKEPRTDVHFVTRVPTRPDEIDQARHNPSLAGEPQDNGEAHALVSF